MLPAIWAMVVTARPLSVVSECVTAFASDKTAAGSDSTWLEVAACSSEAMKYCWR